jgi:hypothetical protein
LEVEVVKIDEDGGGLCWLEWLVMVVELVRGEKSGGCSLLWRRSGGEIVG